MDSKRKKTKNGSLLNQLFNSPVRFLSKVKDLYLKSIAACDAEMGGYGGGAFGCPAYCPAALPRSFSANNGTRSRATNLKKACFERSTTYNELKKRTRRTPATASGVKRVVMAMSYSVGVHRIDEDEVCEFRDDIMIRTRSCVDPPR